MAAQLAQRGRDAPRRNLRRGERLRGAQDDQIPEGEEVGLSRTALRRDETRADKAMNGSARQAQELLDLPHPEALHATSLRLFGVPLWLLAPSSRASSPGLPAALP